MTPGEPFIDLRKEIGASFTIETKLDGETYRRMIDARLVSAESYDASFEATFTRPPTFTACGRLAWLAARPRSRQWGARRGLLRFHAPATVTVTMPNVRYQR